MHTLLAVIDIWGVKANLTEFRQFPHFCSYLEDWRVHHVTQDFRKLFTLVLLGSDPNLRVKTGLNTPKCFEKLKHVAYWECSWLFKRFVCTDSSHCSTFISIRNKSIFLGPGTGAYMFCSLQWDDIHIYSISVRAVLVFGFSKKHNVPLGS